MKIKLGTCEKSVKYEACGAGALAREMPRSAMAFRNNSFEGARLQPGRNHTQKSRALAPGGGCHQ